ncbi:type II toxin-antitoxin system death-on-curing family toxin [Microvirga sp. M2]|uniref:type II toxin-antitoxin system death-on-curing family toxin n=1 Tax=Microvirga sp. M2 TaxID=3073270 RepID=UPI0039C29819
MEICRDAVASTGEPFLLLSYDLLESAVYKPRAHYHYAGERDLLTLATTLLFGIARNHAFEQGNKRAGFIAAVIFLEMNGYMLTIADTEELGDWVLQVLNGDMTEKQFAEALRPFATEFYDG